MKVLVVEDEVSYRAPLVYQLMREGYEVEAAATGEQAWEMWQAGGFGFVLLDVMLPGVDGVTLCRRMRERSAVPIIMLTAKGEERDVVLGLEFGADDYVTKPYSFRALLARMHAVMRRRAAAPDAPPAEPPREVPLVCGPVRMLLASHEVYVHDRPVFFPRKEFEVLELLVRNQGRVMMRQQIIDHVWGADYTGDTKTLDVHIKRIRAKIEPDPSKPRILTTLRGLGYKIDDPARV